MRLLVATLLLCCGAALPAVLAAQDTPQTIEAFETRREELRREVEAAEERLQTLRAERARLQARVDNAVVIAMQDRARELMMSSEQDALQSLDALLATAQSDMLAQRDRMLALGDAVRRRSGAVLVVLIAVDSAAFARLSAADVSVNGVAVATRTYGDLSAEAFRFGAVDQVYRADVLPTAQRVHVRAVVAGQVVEQTLDVMAAEQTTTYLRLTVRGTQLVGESWTTRPDERP